MVFRDHCDQECYPKPLREHPLKVCFVLQDNSLLVYPIGIWERVGGWGQVASQ